MKPSRILPRLIMPILLSTPVIVVLLVGALGCAMVLYGQAKQTILEQQAQIAKLKQSKDKLYSACTDPVYVSQRRGMREWELKHGYR